MIWSRWRLTIGIICLMIVLMENGGGWILTLDGKVVMMIGLMDDVKLIIR
jgi:hypothetical protein